MIGYLNGTHIVDSIFSLFFFFFLWVSLVTFVYRVNSGNMYVH